MLVVPDPLPMSGTRSEERKDVSGCPEISPARAHDASLLLPPLLLLLLVRPEVTLGPVEHESDRSGSCLLVLRLSLGMIPSPAETGNGC